jgi:hypothetical protein
MSERLHLTWQSSAAGALGACLPVGSQVYCTRDPLSFGRLFSTASLEAWTVRRAEWLRRERDERPELVGEAFEPSYAGLPEALEEAGEVSVWVGNTLNDELFVCRCASLVELAGLNPEGGSKHLKFESRPALSGLHEHLRPVRNPGREETAYFLRAESFFQPERHGSVPPEKSVKTVFPMMFSRRTSGPGSGDGHQRKSSTRIGAATGLTGSG